MLEFKKSRLVTFMSLLLIPFAVMLFGILLLCGGAIFSLEFLIMYFIVPIFTVVLLHLTIFSRKSNIAIKIVFVGIILLIFALACGFFYILNAYETIDSYSGEQAIELYSEEKKPLILPTIDEVGGAKEYEYHSYFSSVLMFASKSQTLVCRYDEDDYLMQKEKIEKKYVFQEETITEYGSFCEPYAEVEGYRFRMADVEGEYEDIVFPQALFLIATNDQEKEVAYIFFEDNDLDYIESFTEFINVRCGWEHIR